MNALSHDDYKIVKLANKFLLSLRAKKREKLSEWTANKIFLPDDSAVKGRWNREKCPYQPDIMDAITDPDVKQVGIMSAAQIGKTLILQTASTYHIEQKPTTQLLLFPNTGIVQKFVKTKLRSFIEKNAFIKKLTGALTGSKSENSVKLIKFPGGFITTAGTNASSDLAMDSIGFLLADEVDRFETDVEGEGDPLSLARARGDAYWDFKELATSTPVDLQTSKIYQIYLSGTQERWNMPCPSCNDFQPTELERFDADALTMSCKHCGAVHDEADWKSGKGKFISENEEADGSIKTFHVTSWDSGLINWKRIADKWKEAELGTKTQKKTFRNTVQGLPWDDSLEKVEPEGLAKRCEDYGVEVPRGALFLTAGVDVQRDRLEVNVIGWGLGFENWGIDYITIPGKPEHPETWEELSNVLDRKYEHASGMKMKVARAFVDAGFMQETVLKFCNSKRRVYAIKGQGGQGKAFLNNFHAYWRKPNPKQKPFMLGVDEGKSYAYAYFNVQEEGMGYCHFKTNLHTKEYFDQLTAEERVEVKDKKGVATFIWKKTRDRNEALDTFVYALAAAESRNPNWQKLNRQIVKFEKDRIATKVQQMLDKPADPVATVVAPKENVPVAVPRRKVRAARSVRVTVGRG